MRYFIRLPANIESNPHKLIELCSGCAATLADDNKIIVTDRSDNSAHFGITIYDLRDPDTRSRLVESSTGLHHIERS